MTRDSLPVPSSAGSEEWTQDSLEPDGSTPSSASGTSGGATSSPTIGPESRSTRTFVKSQKAHDPEDCERWEETTAAPALDAAGHGPRTATLIFTQNQREEVRELDIASSLSGEGSHQTTYLASTFSAEDSPARTYPLPESEQDSPASEADSSLSSHESLGLFDPDGFSSRTFPVFSLHTAVGTSESSLERWPTSGTAWDGGLSTHVSSECRSADGGCSSSEPSLTTILEPPQSVAAKYSLSARAASGILRRAQKRGRELPPHLQAALEATAETSATPSADTTDE